MMGMYNASFIEIPLNANVALTYMTNDVPSNELTLMSGSPGVGYRFLEGKIQPSLSISYSENSLAKYTADTQWLFRLGVQWNITDALALSVFGTSNRYNYGSSKPGASFRETFLETSLSTQF